MIINTDTDKINDILDKYSKYTNPSYICAYCFEKDYIKDFCMSFLIDIDKDLFEEKDSDYKEYIKSWFYDGKIADNLIRELDEILSKTEKIIKIRDGGIIKDKLSGLFGLTPYYFLEDLFFVKCHDNVWCFMIGNNE